MTGGQAVILGPTGSNFGAGMTNGQAWIYDPEGTLATRINSESVMLETMAEDDADVVRGLIERHVALTGSAYARDLLKRWDEVLRSFVSIVPKALLELKASQEEDELEQGAAD
jgi:glutamate synthase domain-containing protein 3